MGEEDGDNTLRNEQIAVFSLENFVPLLAERMDVMNAFTRMFLVSWITLLGSIPDLELVSFLPSFLRGLFRFLNDPNPDVCEATHRSLNNFLAEIQQIVKANSVTTTIVTPNSHSSSQALDSPYKGSSSAVTMESHEEKDLAHEELGNGFDEATDWAPGQNVHIKYHEIVDVLIELLDSAGEYDGCFLLTISRRRDMCHGISVGS